jgi:hypothetical protein
LPLDAGMISNQGCQMVYFQTKKSKFGLILKGLIMEDVGYILWTFGLFHWHLIYFIGIRYISW